ncbi:MAG: hypothetical protein QM762_12705 [Chryseolinea sp.]
MAGTRLNDNIRVEAGKPIDDRYLNGVVPYANAAEACSLIVLSRRHPGLTVKIGNDEYWWKSGIQDVDLILKATGGGGDLYNIDGGTASSVYGPITGLDGGTA